MTQKLFKLHARLAALLRRRRGVRWGTAYSALALAALWLLVALFLADWLLRMDRPERIVAMVISVGALVWVFRRFTVPWLGHRETELDMALMVERQQHIDSDVVAAIQFESPEAPQWGSVALEQAVIEHTAVLGEGIQVTEGIPKKPLHRRTLALALTMALVALAVWRFPDYAAIFLNRLLLGNRHYPTRTSIDRVLVNGRPVNLGGWGEEAVKVSYGRPVRFEVACTGQLPETGDVSMKTLRGGLAANAVLVAGAADPELAESRLYTAELPRLMDSVRYQVYVGDAWTEPAELLLVPLPVADVQLEVKPPEYAASEAEANNPVGMRQVAVLEGSEVTLRVFCDKPLKQAQVALEGHNRTWDMAQDLQAKPSVGKSCWRLSPEETPLAAVREAINFSVQVTDTDALELDRPIQGTIRIKPDQPPRVSAAILTRFVLSKAKPTLSVNASDDFGVAELAVLPEVIHAGGSPETREPVILYRLASGQAARRILQQGFHFDLAPLKLVKGDQLKISVRATDYRGPTPGKSSLSEPLVFQVTDEAGILAAISEADKESARQLKVMIERQIDVGEGR